MVKKLSVFLMFLIAAAAAGAWWLAGRAAPTEGEDFALAPVEYGRAAEVVSATGLAQPRDVYTVGAELAGRVVEVRADFNQEIEEGDLLARLDDRALRERQKQADLGVEEAQAGQRQAEALRDAAATAVEREQQRSPEVRRQIDVDVVMRQLKAADAAVEVQRVKVLEAEQAQRHAGDDLRMSEVRAPVLAETAAPSAGAPPRPGGVGALADGPPPAQKRTFTVLDRSVSVNQVVAPPASARLFTLAGGLENLRIEVEVAEADVGRVARGQAADVKGPGPADAAPFAGRVEEVRLTPNAEHGAVFYKAVVGVRNERDALTHDWRLRPGMTANVDLLVRTHDPVWKMPAAALTFQPDPALQTEAARAKLTHWQGVKQAEWWRPVWVLGADRKPWPLFVRTGGRDARGETGVQTAEFSEVLEWDPEARPPEPKDEESYPKCIIAAPPAKRSFFTLPKLKL